MAEYTLYCFAQSGNTYKAALMLNLCNADWTPRFVDFFNGETRTPEYRAHINEMGEVPVLEFGGKRLSQSGVILDFLAAASGSFGWTNGDERREIMRWILWDNHKLTSYIATLRYMLQFAKQAGLRVQLVTDGLFWIEEADEWLIECGVDEIVLLAADGCLSDALAERVRALASRGYQAIKVQSAPM